MPRSVPCWLRTGLVLASLIAALKGPSEAVAASSSSGSRSLQLLSSSSSTNCTQPSTAPGLCSSGCHKCISDQGGTATCKPDNSVQSCGTRCRPCRRPLNATATCTDGKCGFVCNNGLQLARTRADINGSSILSPLCVTEKELQKLVLIQSKATLAGSAAVPALDSWNEAGDVCSTFVGVTCDQWGGTGLVHSIRLTNLSLAGALPQSWGRLTSLQTISLYNNQLGKALPDSWGALTSLSALNLFGNKLSGVVPQSWANMTSLSTLLLHKNRLTDVMQSSAWSALRPTLLAVHNNPRLGGCLPVAWKSGSFNFLTADSRQMLVSGTTSNAFLLQPQGPLFNTNVTGWCSE